MSDCEIPNAPHATFGLLKHSAIAIEQRTAAVHVGLEKQHLFGSLLSRRRAFQFFARFGELFALQS